jgi:GTP-binding protein
MALKLAIVGRPNVGKSTLFNRLAGRKLAIVDDRPGVTRDRRSAPGRLGDLDLELIDTAGFEDVDDESLEARMRIQTERALDECDVALFVIDAREGVTPLDRIFADLVRRRDRPAILVANKAEGRKGDHGAAEAHGLGLGEPIELSAEHGEGLGELYAALLAVAPEPVEDADEDPPGKPVLIAIVGRPNAGKSTLVNRLIGEDRLLVGPEAGITRDSISVDWDVDGRAVRLVDTAGLRRKAKVNEVLEKLSTADTIRAITFAEVVILVMDAANAFETQDLQIADLCEREGRALVYCIAKWDLVDDPQARLAELRETAERQLPQLRGTPLVALSAETGRGVDKLMPQVFEAHRQWSTKVKTRDLNDWLGMAIQRHPPPAVNGKRIKPKYMAQTKARPPTFVLFSSRADQMPESYRRYLVNSLRESFDLPGTPIRVTVKSGANPYVPEEDNRAPDVKKFGRGGPAKTYGAKPVVKPKYASKRAPGPGSTRVGLIKPRAPGRPKGR